MWIFALSALILLAAAAAVAYPLVFQRVVPLEVERASSSQFNERTALLEALSELESEYGAGKVSESDYRRHKARYQRDYLALAGEAAGGSSVSGGVGEVPKDTSKPSG